MTWRGKNRNRTLQTREHLFRTSGLCQQVASAYRRAAKKLEPWAAFVNVLQRSPARINAALKDAVAEVMADAYKLAIKTGDFLKVPSVAEAQRGAKRVGDRKVILS